jgi:2-polyprenyl-3-methyl-5-hydroxy-6-metoxy-1,4-benzoquinol methylase
MNPQPLQEAIEQRYNAESGEDYLAYELTNEKSFLTLALLALGDSGFFTLEKELLEEGGRLLDIGCATGSLIAALRERGWETTGVEISVPQAEYAKQKRNLNVRSLPLEENHFPSSHFNVVLASHLIEHLNDPAAFVREVRRVLKAKGRFFITTPNIAGFQARLFKGRWRSAIFDHLYLFSAKTLSRLLKENGFIIEKTATWGGLAAGIAPTPVKASFDKAAKRFGFGDVMVIRARREDEEA